MPHPIPSEKIISIAVNYLSHRQLQGRSTTLREFGKRMGLGKNYLLRKFDANEVDYQLAAYATEILLVNIPELLADELKIDNSQLYASYLKLYKEPEAGETAEIIPAKHNVENGPYAEYRISLEKYKEMAHDLIQWQDLIRIAKIRGYSYQAIYRATGGPKMRYTLAGPLWRPFIVGNTRYYLSEVTRYLSQSDKTYKKKSTAALKRLQRQQETEMAQ